MMQCSYHLRADLNRITSCFSSTSLKAIHINAWSVKNKNESLDEFFSEFRFQFSVIMLSETWSTSSYNVFKMTNYKTHYPNRPVGRGGAVALLLDVNVITSKYFHCVWVCSVCYHPPSGFEILSTLFVLCC